MKPQSKPEPPRKRVTPPYRHATRAPLHERQNFFYMLIYGPTDSGKTSLALSAPGPLCVLHRSAKLEGLLQRRNETHIEQHGYEIGETDFAFKMPDLLSVKPPHREFKLKKEICNRATESMEMFTATYLEAFSWARTTIIDSEFSLYQTIRESHFGGLALDTAFERWRGTNNLNRQSLWGPLNSQWYDLLRTAVRSQDINNPTNVILIAHEEDEYTKDAKGNDKKTGRKIPRTQKNIPYWPDISIQTSTRSTGLNTKYEATVTKPWDNSSARGVRIDLTGMNESFVSMDDVLFAITGDVDRWS